MHPIPLKPYGKAPVVTGPDRADVWAACNHTRNRIGERDRAILALSFYSGLRAQELAGLTLGMLLDVRGRLVMQFDLPPSLSKGNPKHATVYVAHRGARADIELHLAKRLASGAALSDRVFVNRSGRPFNRDGMRLAIKRMFERASVEGKSHSGRRSFATDLDESGASMETLRVLMRHSAIGTTAIYIATNPTRLRAAVASLV